MMHSLHHFRYHLNLGRFIVYNASESFAPVEDRMFDSGCHKLSDQVKLQTYKYI